MRQEAHSEGCDFSCDAPNNRAAPERTNSLIELQRLFASGERERYLCDITYLFAI